MTHTFAEAKQALAQFASASGLLDMSAAVNEAISDLTRTRSWQRMRKTLRLTLSGGEYFALPQDCGALIRACVDGTPVTLHGADHEFLSAGPGDYDYVTQGLAPLHGIQRVGIFPTMYGVSEAAPIVAFSTSVPAGDIKIKAKNADGDIVFLTVPCTQWTGTEDAGTVDVSELTVSASEVVEILGVTLPTDAQAYISLYAVVDDTLCFLSRMHPRIRIPEFTRYRLPGFSTETDASYRIIAECGIRFLPLVEDDEPVPFDSLRPIQYVLQSYWNMDSGETRTADDYMARAELAMLKAEGVENTRQSMQIMNPLYTGSNGEVSNDWSNC